MKPCSKGMTLIELIVFIVIVSVGLAGVLAVFNTSVTHSADPLVRKQALVVAEALLHEIMQKSFENDPADPNNTSATLGCTPTTTPIRCQVNTPVDRQNYNDVDDFNGFSQSVITELDGMTPVAGLSGYSVAISVAGAALGSITDISKSKRITVTVSGRGESITLIGYRTRYD